MNIYLLRSPGEHEKFARFSHVGTWTQGGLCRACGEGTSKLVSPLQIVWEPDSACIGDFSWCGYTAVGNARVCDFMRESNVNCAFGKVLVLPPVEKSKSKTTVPYPYEGPTLHWIIPQVCVALNETKSQVSLLTDCSICGQKKYTFRQRDLVIDREQWDGQKLFSISQFDKSAAMFVTEELLQELLSWKFSNFPII